MPIFCLSRKYPEEYRSWKAMKDRCMRRKNVAYSRYGGAGIGICQEWTIPNKGFGNFMKDMGPKPSYVKAPGGKRPLYTLDRIDPAKGYCRDNCRWATAKQQAMNKTNNVVISYKGESHCVSEWARILGIKRSTIYMRIHYGKSVEEILSVRKLC